MNITETIKYMYIYMDWGYIAKLCESVLYIRRPFFLYIDDQLILYKLYTESSFVYIYIYFLFLYLNFIQLKINTNKN